MLISCDNSLDKVYNEETFREDMEVIVARDKANQEDIINLSFYMIENPTDVCCSGKTYRQMFKDAKEYMKSKE